MQSARTSFARLAPDVVFHVSPKGGLVTRGTGGETLHVSRAAATGLLACDGARTLGAILGEMHASFGDEDVAELCAAGSELAALLARGVICLDPAPSRQDLHVTGDLDIYYPINMQVELTAACNLSCYYCYRDAALSEPQSRLSTESLLRILTALAQRGLQSVELTGGEPLYHPDFPTIMDFCGERFRIIGLLTNGTMIAEKSLRGLLPYREKLVASISLDSHRADAHDRRRGRRGAFERTTNAIRLLSRAGILTRVSMSVDQDNWGDIEGTLQLAKSLGAIAFAYSPILPFGRGKEGFRLWSQRARDVVETEKRLQDEHRGFLDLMSETAIGRLDEPGGCGAGWRIYAMDPNGHVRPCVTFGERTSVFGCLASQSPEEVFGSALARLYADIVPPNAHACGDCRWALFCRHCEYRGLMASEWVGQQNCNWLNQSAVRQWNAEIGKHALPPLN